jgi:hypothetical protein
VACNHGESDGVAKGETSDETVSMAGRAQQACSARQGFARQAWRASVAPAGRSGKRAHLG